MPSRTITYRDYSKYNHTRLVRDIGMYDWNPVSAETVVNIALDYMEQGLTTIIERHVQKLLKFVKGSICPWLSYKIKRDKVLRKTQKTKNKCHLSIYKRLKTDATIKSNMLSRNIKKTCYSKS